MAAETKNTRYVVVCQDRFDPEDVALLEDYKVNLFTAKKARELAAEMQASRFGATTIYTVKRVL